MAKHGDEWLSREMSGQVRIWFESRHISKIQNGRHKAKEWPTHSSTPKIYTKNIDNSMLILSSFDIEKPIVFWIDGPVIDKFIVWCV